MRTPKFSLLATLTLISISFAAHRTDAGIIATYNNRAAFESTGIGLSTETFNSFVSDTSFRGTALDLDGFSLQATGSAFASHTGNRVDVPALECGFFNVNGSAVATISFCTGGMTTMIFDHATTAFGADFAHLNDQGINAEIVVNGESLALPVASAIEPRFFGFVSDTPFTEIKFRAVANTFGDAFSIDDVTHGGSLICAPAVPIVPEPSSLMAFAAMSFVACGSRRRRNR